MALDPTKAIRALPFQIIDLGSATVVKRGCTEVRIGGEYNLTKTLHLLLSATSAKAMIAEEIFRLFLPIQRQNIERIIEELLSRRLLVYADESEHPVKREESNLDILYWHFTDFQSHIVGRLNAVRLVILGVNFISRQMSLSLRTAGMDNFTIVDHPILRNLNFYTEEEKLKSDMWMNASKIAEPLPLEVVDLLSADCVIATADFGVSPAFRDLNAFCVEKERHFLPVFLKNMIGSVGPFVIPGETACFNCLQARENAHLQDFAFCRSIEEQSYIGQTFAGYHPSMASMLGDIAVIELTKFYSGVLPAKVGTLVEVNLLLNKMTPRRVLKVPRCSTCSPLNTRSSTTPMKNMFGVSNHISQ